ncbi:GTPase HflX [Haematospirillum sp. 15-248]|uniref:GTPase HflX n=1 Tax=Haematospirillum sp. 15-248 TaxID=2723107 RepID=UPI00143B6277|nr:GTPase HflX [Haematospirillum sp. 15-248]NKD54271.1 GTPase HflX [Haematospirillum sp. H4890]NKD74316.1 GTPase HflX [Haematospirillum sp. H4485]NKD87014.1 GTPase HflX [Haematospirillum sp. 15-248]
MDSDHPAVSWRSKSAVLCPFLKKTASGVRTPEARLAEAVGLAKAIDLDIVLSEVALVSAIRPATYIGGGLVERLAPVLADLDVDIVIVDARLSPVQQRNLEKAWGTKVIDRTGLILEIFGARARTREGQLQVELAHLEYQKSRLVRSWTHLERQRGGFGFMGGPGESQIEIDRRLIGDRIVRLKKDLESVKRTRALHRKARKRTPFPIIALVGYTNAGKSTLFNQMTHAAVMAENQLFATLDPTMRALQLPSGRTVILSDTVGFVSDLPHELVAAFHATLEEVLEADLILHVRDYAHPDSESQKLDVEKVLRDELGLDPAVGDSVVEVLNKADLLVESSIDPDTGALLLSALSGDGVDNVLRRIDDCLALARVAVELVVPPSDGKILAWIYRRGEVLSREDHEEGVRLIVRLDPADAGRLATRTTSLPD